MNSTIAEILYLTHDKWENKTIIAHREDFKQYLEDFLSLEPEAENDLKIIIDLGQQENNLVIMKGVINILRNNYLQTHKTIIKRAYAKRMKKELYKC